MKSAKLFALSFLVFAAIPLTMAQEVNARAQQNASASVAGTQVNDSVNAGANASPGHAQANAGAAGSAVVNGDRANASASSEGSAEMRPVTGELEGKLDSKTARSGDPVVVKTTQKMKTADGTEIPKGTRLVGHVTEVQAHEKGHAESQMGLEFDRAELKGGQAMAIHSMIQSVQPNPSAMAASSVASEDALDTPMGGGAVGAGGGAMASGRAGGGGLLGGTAGGVASATGRVGSDLGSTAGGAMRTTGNLGSGASANLAHGVGSTANGAGSLGARATGMPGVMLRGDAAGSASGVLSASNKNIHLDSGTQIVLGVAASR